MATSIVQTEQMEVEGVEVAAVEVTNDNLSKNETKLFLDEMKNDMKKTMADYKKSM